VTLDSYCAAAPGLDRLSLAGLAHAVAGHCSAEAGHKRLLEALRLSPLLELSMRLGEGSGACLAISIVRAAIACHNGMASFADAGVSSG
jgi:nicotinate-nucleotide--dimethylbenzimidazole phosphoribosyltransferase